VVFSCANWLKFRILIILYNGEIVILAVQGSINRLCIHLMYAIRYRTCWDKVLVLIGPNFAKSKSLSRTPNYFDHADNQGSGCKIVGALVAWITSCFKNSFAATFFRILDLKLCNILWDHCKNECFNVLYGVQEGKLSGIDPIILFIHLLRP